MLIVRVLISEGEFDLTINENEKVPLRLGFTLGYQIQTYVYALGCSVSNGEARVTESREDTLE